VRRLAAILRVADAFDREHEQKVREVAVRITPGRIALRAIPRVRPDGSEPDLALERWTAQRKADLMMEEFQSEVRVDGAETAGALKGFV
jgi:exopolyphosphatase/guanosine-5'-triphosphate,3'-diphosphate pyrophosphatase